MAKLTYRGVTLQISDTQSVSRDAIMSTDGQDYLYTRFRFAVGGIYNPRATAYTAGPVATPGTMPPITDISIRNTLMQPGGVLVWDDESPPVGGGPVTILRVPAANGTGDVKGGPYPRGCHVAQIAGTKTWWVVFLIETFVNEQTAANMANVYNRPSNIVLSHRWDITADYNQDHFATRIVRGEVVFRLDLLTRNNVSPDQFRDILFHPVPANFQRSNIRVMPSSDGTTYKYEFTDTEQPLNYSLGPNITRIEATETDMTFVPSQAQALQENFVSNLHGGVSAASSILSGNAVGGLTGFVSGAAHNAIDTGVKLLPQCASHIIVRVWGNQQCLRANLFLTAMGVAWGRMNWLNLGYLPGIESQITFDLTNKFVEAQLTFKYGPNALTLLKMSNLPFALPDILNETITSGGVPVIGTLGPNPVYPTSGNTRGTWIGGVIAQSLQGPGALPAAPVNTDNTDQSFR